MHGETTRHRDIRTRNRLPAGLPSHAAWCHPQPLASRAAGGGGESGAQVIAITACRWTSVRDWWRIDRNDALGGVVDGRVSGTPATRTPHQRQVRRAPRHAATPRHLCGADPAPPRKQLWPVPDLTRAASPWVGVTSSSHRSCRTLLAALAQRRVVGESLPQMADWLDGPAIDALVLED